MTVVGTRTNTSPFAWPDIMLPSRRSRIGNPFLKSGWFVCGVSAMISLLIRFRHYCKLKMPVVNESMARFMLLVNLPLCRSGECCTIIGGEFLNAFACELVL